MSKRLPRVQTSKTRWNWYLEKKILLFHDLWTLGIIKSTIGGKTIPARLSDLTSTCTDGHFDGKMFSNKTIFFIIFLWFEPQIFRVLGKHLVRLSNPPSICTSALFVVNQTSVKNIYFLVLSGVRAYWFRTSGGFFSAMVSKLHFASPEDHSDTFS